MDGLKASLLLGLDQTKADKGDTYRIVPPAAPTGFILPMESVERLPLALAHLDGWVESVLALLRYFHLILPPMMVG